MALANLQCPNCRSRFKLKADNIHAMMARPFNCPKCGYAATFGALMGAAAPPPPSPSPMHTHIGGTPRNNPQAGGYGETRIASASNNKVWLEVEGTGKTLQLGLGKYTMGRDSADSRASLKIAPDKYMSRMQAVIDITQSPNPAVPLNVVIQNLSQTSPVYVNAQQLGPGMTMGVKNGDVLLLGMTKVKLKM